MAKQPTLVWDDAPSSTPTKPVKLIFDDEFKPASSTVPSKPPAALAPAKRLGKTRTVSWLGESNLPVVGQHKHPGGSQVSDVISYPAPTKENPGARVFLVPPSAKRKPSSPRDANILNAPTAQTPDFAPMVVEQGPDGSFVRRGSYRPAAAPVQQAAPAQSPAPEQPRISDLMRNRETVEQWKSRRPKEVAELERDYTTYAELKDRNPMLALQFRQSAEEKYAKLQAELGSPDQFISQQRQVEMGMLTPPQLAMQGEDGRTASIQSLRGSDTQGAQASQLGAGVGEQAAQYDDAAARVAAQRGYVSGNAAGRTAQAFGTGVESVAAGAARLLPGADQDLLNEVSRNQASFQQAAGEQAGGGWLNAGVERAGQGIAQSYGVVAPGAALGAVTGGAATGMALATGLAQYGQAYQQATDAGLRGADREQFATVNAAAESLMSLAFTKLLKMPGLEGAFAKGGLSAETVKGVLWKAAQTTGRSGLEELPEEVLTQIVQNVNTRMSGVDPSKKVLTGDELFDIAVQSMGAAGGARAIGIAPSIPGEISKANVIRGNAKAYVETPTGPADWAKSHPMAAEEIAAVVQEGKPVSRAMMEANSLPTMDSVKRSKWAADVHAAVKNQVADAAGLGEAVAATPDAAESQNPIPTEVQRSEDLRGRIDAERASQAAAVRNLGPEYEQRAQAIEAGAEDAAITQDIERRMAEEESAPFSNSPKPRGPQFVNNAQPIEDAAEGSFGAPQTGDEVVDTREVEGKAGKGTRRGRVVSVEGDWATVQPKFGKQYKVPVGRLEVRGRPGTPKAKGLQEQPVGEGEDFVTPMGGSLSRNTVAPQDQQQGQVDNVAQPDLAELTSPEQPAPAAQPQAEVPPTQQAEVGEPAPAPTRSLKKPALTQGQQIRVISRAYPGTDIKPVAGEQGRYTVTLPNGKFLTVLYTPEVVEGPANRERLRQSLEARSGRPVTEAELDNATVTGFWRVSDGKGFETDGQGLVRILDSLGEGQATATALHEARHSLVSMGLMTEAEFDALAMEAARKSGQKPKTIADAEEMIAALAEKGDLGARGFIQTIRDIINRFMAAITGDKWKPNAQTATKRIQSGKVLRRAGKTESRREAAGRLSAKIGGDVRYSAEMNSPLQVESVDLSKFGWREQDDDYIYHVTSKPNADKIAKSGFSRGKSMFTAGSYPAYSKGKTFFTDRSGVKYWEDRVEQQLFHSHDDPPDVAVIRIPKSLVADMLQDDKTGTDDAKHNAYYIDTNKLTAAQKKAAGGGAADAEVGGDVRYAAAFHGSPHTFPKFSSEKIGTGEGEQFRGHGLYYASAKAIAESYRDLLSKSWEPINQRIDSYLSHFGGRLPRSESDKKNTINAIASELPQEASDLLRALDGHSWMDMLPSEAVKASLGGSRVGDLPSDVTKAADAYKKKYGGRLYEVDLKPKESEYLLWDEPVKKQSAIVRDAIRHLIGDLVDESMTGGQVYGTISRNSGGPYKASMALLNAGVRGNKYLDGTSRSQGEGSHNYVIFDDADVDITEMYSAELAGAKPDNAKDKAAAAKAWREQGVESPWFKRWFGDSKVRSLDKKPLVVYHGAPHHANNNGMTLGGFSVFDRNAASKFHGEAEDVGMDRVGSWFSTSPSDKGAGAFAGDTGAIYPAYLSIKNPWITDFDSFLKNGQSLDPDRIKKDKERKKKKLPPLPPGRFNVSGLRDWMKERGYDGIRFTGKVDFNGQEVWVALESNQIKSATANNGTFSPDNADIRYSADPSQAKKERVASLANPGMSPDVRNQIDAERLAMDAPETQPLAEVQRLADAITPDQVRAALASGKPITAPEMEAARRLKESVTRNALVNRTAANLAESAKAIAQYDLIGTESARAFNIRRDRVETPFQRNQRLLGDELIGAPKSIRDAIKDALRMSREALLKGDKKTAKVERDRATKLSREGARMAEKNRAFLERIGLLPKDGDEAAWNEIFGNDIKSFRLLREASALNQGYGSAIMEYWNSLLLSGPATQFRNLLGTPLNYSIEAFIERPLLAAARVAIGKQSAGDTLRAANEWWKGFSLSGAWRHAADSYRQETSTFDRLFKDEDYGGLLENMDGYYSIRGLKGRVIRGLGWGPLRAADQFWKALIGGMEVGRFAYAQARSELGANAKSEDISNRMAEIMADYQSDAWEKASARSDIATFTEKGSETRHQVKQRVKALRNVVPGAKFIIPFIDTPVNIAAQTIERAPALGAIRYLFKMRDNIKNKRPTFDGLGEAAVKQLVSTAALTALLQSGLLSDDDDKYFAIRSGQHADPLKRYTFKWGDTDLSYQGLEPVASLLSLMADWNASRRSGVNPGTVIVGSTIDQIANKPMLQGLGDILQIMNPRDYGTADSKWKTMEANGLNYAKNFGASWVPAIYKQTVKALRPNAVNTRIMATDAEGKDKWTLAGKRMVEQAEIGWMLEKAGFKDPPAAQVDVFGKQKSNVILDGQSWWSNPGTDFLYRLTSPLRTTEQNAHPANELLAAWNRTKPEGAEDYKLSAVEPRYTDSKGRPSVMDEHQFEQLQKLAGGIADKLYAKGKFDPKNPTESQVAMLTERLLPAAKEEARRLVVDSIVTGKPVTETIDQIAERVEKKVRVSVFNAASEKVKRTMNKGEVDWQRDRRVEKSLKKREVAREQREKLRE